MCTDPAPSHPHPAVPSQPQDPDRELADEIGLEPVDASRLATVADNQTGLLLPDQGPVTRTGLGAAAAAPSPSAGVLDTGNIFDIPLAQHGFAMLVTITRTGREHRLLYGAGMTSGGLCASMRRVGLSPGDIEIVVLSHGHSGHVTGMDGFIRAAGPANLPPVVHPAVWAKRRIAIPGLAEFELSSPSPPRAGHAGLINITRYARQLTSAGRLAAVVGRFHLSGPGLEPAIAPTIDALTELAPGRVVPAHCTSWQAAHALATALPVACIQKQRRHHYPTPQQCLTSVPRQRGQDTADSALAHPPPLPGGPP